MFPMVFAMRDRQVHFDIDNDSYQILLRFLSENNNIAANSYHLSICNQVSQKKVIYMLIEARKLTYDNGHVVRQTVTTFLELLNFHAYIFHLRTLKAKRHKMYLVCFKLRFLYTVICNLY